MSRELIAYFLIAVMIAGAAAVIAYMRYNSFERSYARRRRRERERRQRAEAEGAELR